MRGLCGVFLVAVIAISTLGALVSSHRALGAASFDVSPAEINRHQTVRIIIRVTSGVPLATYEFNVSVALPDLSVFFRVVSFQVDASGSGESIPYYFWSDFPGADTVLDGEYRVQVGQLQPVPLAVGDDPFWVTSQISLAVLSPNSTDSFTRGDTTSVIAEAKDVQGLAFPGLNVNFTTPSNNTLILPNLLGTGIYQRTYTVRYDDPLSWRIVVTASDSWGNFGSRTVNVLVQPAVIDIDPPHLTDSTGTELSSTSLNQTIYIYFRAKYPDGSFVTSGSAVVTILGPDQRPMARLNATYSDILSGFFTSTGYAIPMNEQAGRWSAIIYTGDLNDTAGNSGPKNPTLTVLNVAAPPFTISLVMVLPVMLLGLGALGSAVILTKKGRTGFEYFEKMTGGGIPDGCLVMLYGESKSGKSLFLEELLYERLREGKPCIYITYELTSEEILKNAEDFKWELEPFIEKGQLTLIDNSDLMSSLDLSRTRMKLSSALTMKENRGLHLFIDSMDLLFEDLDYREVKLFLSRLTEEVRKLHGSVYFSLTTSQIIAQTIPEIQDIIDWTIELRNKRRGNKLERTMTVKRLKDPSFKGASSRFRLMKKKGFVFDVPLIQRLGRN